MAPVEETRQRAARLRAQARDARSQARDVTEQVRLVAETAAGIEDTIAATFEQLARDRPDREGPLRATSEAARRCAARERKRATRAWRREPRPRAGGGNPPAAQTPGPGPTGMAEAKATMPEGRASANTPGHPGELPVFGVHDHVATSLRDTIVRRIFAAGLSLQIAAELTADPVVYRGIEAAVTQLDEVIAEVRNVVFPGTRGPRPAPRSAGPSGPFDESPHLTSRPAAAVEAERHA